MSVLMRTCAKKRIRVSIHLFESFGQFVELHIDLGQGRIVVQPSYNDMLMTNASLNVGGFQARHPNLGLRNEIESF